MNIVKATRLYEKWLRGHTRVVEADLRLKHARMKESPFVFLRGTFYRWIQLWPKLHSKSETVARVAAVGDLHVENFGTWRDREGRLIWGVNDFDEAYHLPFTQDLVRLATSAVLAIEEHKLSADPEAACAAILAGYIGSIEHGGRPFVLGEHNSWLRDIAYSRLRDPVHFWERMDRLKTLKTSAPASAVEALEHLLPEKGLQYRLAKRIAGMGSLGHQRIVALCDWRGGRIAREAKALVPSACFWEAESEGAPEIQYLSVMSCAVRCPDPFVQVRGHWIVRRLAPDCSRVELATLPEERDEMKLLQAMGAETANIHLGTAEAKKLVLRDLKKQKSSWLISAVKSGAEAVLEDWHEWKKADS